MAKLKPNARQRAWYYYDRIKQTGNKQKWAAVSTNTGLYLLTYEMEAVSFTNFLYEEAIQWGIRFLRLVKSHKDYDNLHYFLKKFYKNIWQPAAAFGYAYGPLNPYSWPGFKAYLETSYAALKKLDSEFGKSSAGYSHD